MLKKSLHYLIRCSFLLVIICSCFSFNSCLNDTEDYFLFLKKSRDYNLKIYIDEDEVAGCLLKLTYDGGKSEGEMIFNFPESLEECNVSVLFCNEGNEFLYNGEKLDRERIPVFWHEIYKLFLPGESVISTQVIDGATVIEVSKENDGENILYKLDKNGLPTEIIHGNIKIDIISTESEVKQ